MHPSSACILAIYGYVLWYYASINRLKHIEDIIIIAFAMFIVLIQHHSSHWPPLVYYLFPVPIFRKTEAGGR